MLLAIDVGNTHIVFGLYQGKHLRHHWRLRSNRATTADEVGVFLGRLLRGIGNPSISGVAISSVVPPLTQVLVEMSQQYLKQAALVVGPGVTTGMPILYDDPRQLGTDRLVNAIAAYERTKGPTIVVDCGTATKFEYVNGAGEYLGGAIAPGLGIASDALSERAARLHRVELVRPPKVLGRNTIHSIQSGLIYGYASMLDGMVARIRREHDAKARVVATGGFSTLLVPATESIEIVDEFLTLDGLRLIYERNIGQ